MDCTVYPAILHGAVKAPSSKSMAHRLIMCAALSDHTTSIDLTDEISNDIQATISCLEKLGAHITKTKGGLRVRPLPFNTQKQSFEPVANQILDAQESGTTFRFMLTLLAALQTPEMLMAEGRMSERPIDELFQELIVSGASISDPSVYPIRIDAGMRAGKFELPGDISSQYISALLLALPLLPEASTIEVAHPLASKSYIAMTIEAIKKFNVQIDHETLTREDKTYTVYKVPSCLRYTSPREVGCEGDWSNAAPWLVLGALNNNDTVEVLNLDMQSKQGDRSIMAALSMFGARVRRTKNSVIVQGNNRRDLVLDCNDIPDLVPVLAALGAHSHCKVSLTHIERLKLKESDRIEAITSALSKLQVPHLYNDGTLNIEACDEIKGGLSLSSYNDHRITMMLALLGCFAKQPITIKHAESIAKSYPAFFNDLIKLGGKIQWSK